MEQQKERQEREMGRGTVGWSKGKEEQWEISHGGVTRFQTLLCNIQC